MEVMVLVSTRDSGKILKGLAAALARAGVDWGCFFTNDGVELAAELTRDAGLAEALASSSWVNVCEHSWHRFGEGDCPIELGSQTQNSMMMGGAKRVVSL